MGLLDTEQRREVQPIEETPRYPCPFYGFHFCPPAGTINDQQGNQCALVTDVYSPCKLEVRGRSPDFRDCPFNNDRHRESLEAASRSRVFPREFSPRKKGSSSGFKFEDWKRDVMDATTSRP